MQGGFFIPKITALPVYAAIPPPRPRGIEIPEKGIAMKNIHTILTEYGIEIPADKKADFDKAVAENYKTVAEVEKITTARDSFKAQLDTATAALDKFKDVDVSELQGQIAQLTKDLDGQKTAFEAKIADMEFDAVLNAAITKAGARSVKAVRAELDLDAIKASRNRDTDLTAALEKCKEENGFLFGADEPINNPIVGKGGNNDNPLSDAALRSAFGLPAEKKT